MIIRQNKLRHSCPLQHPCMRGWLVMPRHSQLSDLGLLTEAAGNNAEHRTIFLSNYVPKQFVYLCQSMGTLSGFHKTNCAKGAIVGEGSLSNFFNEIIQNLRTYHLWLLLIRHVVLSSICPVCFWLFVFSTMTSKPNPLTDWFQQRLQVRTNKVSYQFHNVFQWIWGHCIRNV